MATPAGADLCKMDASPYGQLPASGSTPPPAFSDIRAAFDIDRGLRRGIAGIRRAPWVLVLGGFLKGCTEGGGGVNVPNPDDYTQLREMFDKVGASGHSALPGQPGWFAADGGPFAGVDALAGVGLGVLGLIVVVAVVLVVVMFLANGWLGAGWIRLHAQLIRTGEALPGTLFSATDCFGTMLAWSFTSGLIGLAGVAIAIAPFGAMFFLPEGSPTQLAVAVVGGVWFLMVVGALLYLRMALSLVAHVIALEGQSMMAAIERSFSLTSGGRFHLLLYMSVFSFIGLLVTLPGYCLCIVGVLLSRPLGVAMRDLPFTEGFLHLTQPPEAVAAHSISTWGDD